MSTAINAGVLPPVQAQAMRLLDLGVHELAPGAAASLRALAGGNGEDSGSSLLAVHPDVAPASLLAPLLRRGDQSGFVVVDMTDVDRFRPLDEVAVPDSSLYLVDELDRGDAMLNWSPDEALPAISAQRRTPLLLTEGVHWLLQTPEVLQPNRCFMTIGSRLRRSDGRLDARTPAIWISGGTGRDGRERRGAPKIGWCWAGNRHTWLGFASAAGRRTDDRLPTLRSAAAIRRGHVASG